MLLHAAQVVKRHRPVGRHRRAQGRAGRRDDLDDDQLRLRRISGGVSAVQELAEVEGVTHARWRDSGYIVQDFDLETGECEVWRAVAKCILRRRDLASHDCGNVHELAVGLLRDTHAQDVPQQVNMALSISRLQVEEVVRLVGDPPDFGSLRRAPLDIGLRDGHHLGQVLHNKGAVWQAACAGANANVRWRADTA